MVSSFFEVTGGGDEHLVAGFSKELVDLGAAFDGARFGAVGSVRDLVGSEGEQDAVIYILFLARGGMQEKGSPMSQRGQGTLEREAGQRDAVGAGAVLQDRADTCVASDASCSHKAQSRANSAMLKAGGNTCGLACAAVTAIHLNLRDSAIGQSGPYAWS